MSQAADDLVAIRNTLSAYAVAGDRLRIEALADTFLEDGVLVTPTATYEGRAEIIRGLGGRGSDPAANQGPRPSLVRHNLTTSYFEPVTTDSAQGRTYFIVLSDIGLDHAGHYQDRLRKVRGQWLFERRDVRVDWIADGSLFPALKRAHEIRLAATRA